MSRIDEFTDLKKKVDEIRNKAEQAKGARSQALKQLREKYDCATIMAARKKLKQLEKQEAKVEEKYDEALESFKSEWEGKL